jgi:hypothetical protein
VSCSINVSLDGYGDHLNLEGFADDELHDFFTAQFDEIDVELFDRVTDQLMAA